MVIFEAAASNSGWDLPRAGTLKGRPLVRKTVPREVGRKEVLTYLRRFGKLGEGLIKMLNLPEKIYMEDEKHFLSEKDKRPICLTSISFMHDVSPDELAKYSIAIGFRGGTTFCTLIDKQRGIIASAPLQGLYSEKSSWDNFETSLGSAIVRAEIDAEPRIKGFVVDVG